METLVYYSRNRKKPPFKVTINIEGPVAYINCDCPLGVEKKICRHKINAIRGDKQKRHDSTSDSVIQRLRSFFGIRSTLRQHLEEKWRMLRVYASDFPEDEDGIAEKRRILGEAFANGFFNEYIYSKKEPFDADSWEDERQTIADGLNCQLLLNYLDGKGQVTERKMDVKEIFINRSEYYLYGYCHLRNQDRTFRVSRVQGATFLQDSSQYEKSVVTKAIFQGSSCTL